MNDTCCKHTENNCGVGKLNSTLPLVVYENGCFETLFTSMKGPFLYCFIWTIGLAVIQVITVAVTYISIRQIDERQKLKVGNNSTFVDTSNDEVTETTMMIPKYEDNS